MALAGQEPLRRALGSGHISAKCEISSQLPTGRHDKKDQELAAKSHPAFLSKHVMFKYVLQRTLSWAEESKTSVRSRGGSPSSRSTLKPLTLNPKTPTVGATDVVVVVGVLCVCVLLYMCIYVCKYIYIYRFVRHVLFSTLFWLMVFGSKCTRPVGINTSTE